MDPRFAAVRDCFHDLLASGRERGAGLAVWYDGHLVVDLVGGTRDGTDEAGTRDGEVRTGTGTGLPWRADTLVNVYSTGKPLAALCVLLLVERRRIGLDDPVHRHWPGFRTVATVRQVLAHTAGLPTFPVPRPTAAFGDWTMLTGDLAAAEPEWEPGTAAGEHAMTYGHLAGELVRRVDGRSMGRFLADEIAGPWRLDVHFGLGGADQRRCADLSYGSPDWPDTVRGAPGSLWHRALGNPAGALDLSVVNGPDWRAAQVPAVNLHATAAGLARCYAGLLAGGVLDGVRLLGPGLMEELTGVQYIGPDLLLDREVRWTLGMQVEEDGSWGMGGIGGSCAYADPARGFAFAYAPGRLADSDRVRTLVDVVESALDGDRTRN